MTKEELSRFFASRDEFIKDIEAYDGNHKSLKENVKTFIANIGMTDSDTKAILIKMREVYNIATRLMLLIIRFSEEVDKDSSDRLKNRSDKMKRFDERLITRLAQDFDSFDEMMGCAKLVMEKVVEQCKSGEIEIDLDKLDSPPTSFEDMDLDALLVQVGA